MKSSSHSLPPDVAALLATHREIKKLERANAAKVMRHFRRRMTAQGWTPRASYLARRRGLIAEFIHVHKFSFVAGFRIHACVRVLNDPRSFLGLIGIASDEHNEYRLRLVFGATETTQIECVDKMTEYVRAVAEPWFEEQTLERLLQEGSVLAEDSRAALRAALNGDINGAYVAQSEKLLGLI